MPWDPDYDPNYLPQPYQLQEIDISRLPKDLLVGLKKINSAGDLQAEMLQKPGTEVWILQCSKDVKLTPILEGKKLRLDDSQPTVLLSDEDGKKYESTCISQTGNSAETIAAMVPSEAGSMSLISAPVAGRILIRQALEDLPCPSFSVLTEKPKHKLPTGIKERHPIYGVNFERILASMENDTDDVDSAFKNQRKRSHEYSTSDPTKKKKHKKNRAEIIPDSDFPNHKESVSKIEIKEEPPTPSKKKKHKKSQNLDDAFIEYCNNDYPTEVEVVEPLPKKKKKHKKNKLENDSDSRNNQELIHEVEVSEEPPAPTKKKKHKKSKNFDEPFMDYSHSKKQYPTEVEIEEPIPKKKKKHKRDKGERLPDSNIANNEELIHKIEIKEEPPTPTKKRKHKKSKNVDDGFIDYYNNKYPTEEVEIEEPVPKKKKKHNT